MTYKEKWSGRAKSDYSIIIGYLLKEFGEKTALSFINRIEHFIELLKHYPEMYPVSKKRKGVHRGVLSKQTTVYYSIKGKTIEIITLSDNRQDSRK